MSKKLTLWLLIALLVVSSLAGCSTKPAEAPKSTEAAAISLEDVNKFLNESAALGEGSKANPVAVIPIKHIDGPKNEDTFYGFVTYKFKARNFIKYQISYVSCTCRQADNNYWQTAYVELTLPESGKIEDAKIKTLSYDLDSDGHYTPGNWGDSDPTPAGATFEDFKTQFIPYFVDKSLGEIKDLSTMDDIDLAAYQSGDGRSSYTIDTFTGSSVSANNIIRMLQALYEYHGTDEFFTGEKPAEESKPAEEVKEEAKEETEEKAEESKEETTPADGEEVTTTKVANLPVPVDTTKMFKPDKDSAEIPCTDNSFSPSCSAITPENFINFIGRDDVYYIDLRDYEDYIKKHFRNFEVVPFFAMIFDAEAGTEGKPHLYSGTPKEPVPTYNESDELLEVLFPKDKTLMLMCQSGGRVGMLMDILKARGWDMSKIYNIGGMAQYTDSKYKPFIVDALEFTVDGNYSLEGLTPASN